MFFQIGLPFIVGIFALIGVILVLTTRPDAFDAADRRTRGVWAGLLGGSAVFLLVPLLSQLFLGIPMIAGMVITGIYWFDVRPQIKDLLANAQG
ncbi:DUF2516 family protein [Corynebacterium sp. TAE3-ERU12]|nr:DUF2516 family protein [Corynebacterium sp. TAE3-ERU12]MBV7294523.1 DUF2516 family protein [Corynebacterium sp. TAE3-ERU12]